MANENLSRDMEISYCYKCALRKIKVGGAFYCQECSKRLCKDCAALHTAKKRHRGHEIREIMEYPKSPMTLADKDEIGSLINSPTGCRPKNQYSPEPRMHRNHAYDDTTPSDPPYLNQDVPITEEDLHDYEIVDLHAPDMEDNIGYNFIVDIASTPLAEKCKVVGKKILFIHVRGITVKEPSTGNGVFTYQLTWIRRYGNKSGIFYFEVGRKCPHSEGNIEMRCKDEKTAKVIQKSVLKCTQLYENKKSKDKTL
ncbi:uncharacterized protein LOC128208170 [Mya arenaria]|uniref:uncharacterized protein LOC128208170 n=1 Tax=Mya arenaria TaxID=6604 RepID=UPI0022E090A2|nr:uncharacterized protein LOC128208170 [Mya arenaria]